MRLLMRAGFDWNAPHDARQVGYGNSGNLLFAQSVYDRFSTSGDIIDVDRYDPCFASADEINEKYDAFIIPLANAFRPVFERPLRQYTELIRRLRIPCVVIGVGAQAGLDLEKLKGSPIDAWVYDFVAAVLDRSATIGVRGEFTFAYLKRLGFHAVDIVGCPSLYAEDRVVYIRKLSDPPRRDDPIAINHTPGLGLEAFVRGTLNAYENSVFVAQQSREVYEWGEVISKMRAGSEGARVRHFANANDWIAFMRTRRFSVGTRIHGNIAGLLAGVPAVVLAHDSRTLELARYHDIPHVMATEIDGMTTLDSLYQSADFGRFNEGASDRLCHYHRFLARNELTGLLANATSRRSSV